MTTNTVKRILLTSVCLAGLSACAGNPQGTQSQQMDSALSRAADQTSSATLTADTLKLLDINYRRAPENPEGAIRYARALREYGDYAKASVVLQPFVNQKNSSPFMKTEYAAIHAEAGKYQEAETFARKAVEQDPTNGQALHILGIAQDAQGKHKEAEESFRSALQHWSGDPVPVMNNLALSLTAQGYLDEAAETLRAAKDLAPSRVEIERNLRIVNALRETEFSQPLKKTKNDAPLPLEKPGS